MYLVLSISSRHPYRIVFTSTQTEQTNKMMYWHYLYYIKEKTKKKGVSYIYNEKEKKE